MIRLLVCLECVLLVLVSVDRLVVTTHTPDVAIAVDSGSGAGRSAGPVAGFGAVFVARPRAASPALQPRVDGIPAAARLPEARVIRAPLMRRDDQMAIARDLLGIGPAPTLPADPPARSPLGAARPLSPMHAVAAVGALPSERGAITSPRLAKTGTDADGRLSAEAPAGNAAAGEPAAARITAAVAEAQRLLSRLGYRPGPVDGVLGRRTEESIRDYQQRSGNRVDGQLSEELLAGLRRDANRLAPAGRDDASGDRARPSGTDGNVGVGPLASMFDDHQRPIAHRFDSVRRPGDLRTYCRSQPDSWIYDDGRRELLYCGEIVASSRNG